MIDYQKFLASKFKFTQAFGFELSPADVHPLLKPHQNDLACWAVRRERAAIFAAFGLGKSLIQIEVLRAIMRHEGGKVLVIAPLGEEHIALGEALDERGVLPATFMSLAPGSHNDEVWHDVNRMRTLNGDQTQRGLTNHICPLQFDIVDRIIRRYTNDGEVVYDPFGGIMTVPYRAIKLGRRGRAAELNAEYFRDGVRYLREIELKRNAPSLFDALAVTEPQAVSA